MWYGLANAIHISHLMYIHVYNYSRLCQSAYQRLTHILHLQFSLKGLEHLQCVGIIRLQYYFVGPRKKHPKEA